MWYTDPLKGNACRCQEGYPEKNIVSSAIPIMPHIFQGKQAAHGPHHNGYEHVNNPEPIQSQVHPHAAESRDYQVHCIVHPALPPIARNTFISGTGWNPKQIITPANITRGTSIIQLGSVTSAPVIVPCFGTYALTRTVNM